MRSSSTATAIRLPALSIAYYSGVGAQLGLTWRVLGLNGVSLSANQKLVPIAGDGWVTLPVTFQPVPGRRYTLNVSGTDASGHPLVAKRTLVAVN